MGLLSDHLGNAATGIRMGYPCVDADLLERAAAEIRRLSNGNPATEAMPGLTPRQHLLMVFIERSFNVNGYAPSLDEMADALGFSTRSGVHRLLRGLIERGYVSNTRGRARSLTILRRVTEEFKFEPVPATSHCLAEARKDGDVIPPSTSPSINPRTSDLSHGDCGRRTEDKGSDEAAPVRVAGGPVTLVPVNSSRPAESFEPGGLTPAGCEGAGDGDSAPRTPVTSMTSTDHARSGGLHVEDDLALPAFLDRRGHG